MKVLKDFNFKNKRVLVRCDFNVPFNEKGDILDLYRIKQTIPTIKYLIKNKAKIILMSHLGSPKGEKKDELKIKLVQKELIKFLNSDVISVDDCIGKDIEKKTLRMKAGEVLLLENLRFHKEEEDNDLKFSKELAKLADIYINDAFSVCHRKHASIVGVPKYLESGIGLLLEKEIEVLSKVLENPLRPLVAIVGGAKIESKIKVIEQFLEKADHLLIGGKIANAILVVKGICVGRPWPEESAVENIKDLNLTSTKLHLPIDVLVSPDDIGKVYLKESAPAKARKDEMILDIGHETVDIFSRIIKEAKMIVWSGPVGFFERAPFEKGTKKIAEAIVKNKKAFKIVGGGDTIFAISKFGLRNQFDHVSTGGGAMLKFLSGDKLPGLEVLE
ncbi:MAG: phosphoglycerate kinase [Candidatus Nealsonbacteria bacterium]